MINAAEGLKAGGLLYLPEGLVLVQRRGSGRDGLVIPKGSIEPQDDNLARTAEREVLEETGYRSKVDLFLGEVRRDSIDVDSPEARKRIAVFLVGVIEFDPALIPQEEVCIVDPYKAAYGDLMRYPEEQNFIARNLGALQRVHGWQPPL